MKTKPLTDENGEVRELTQQDIKTMRPAHEVLPEELLAHLPKRTIGQRGKQKSPTKIAMTLRYSPEVIEYFKSTGDGWQVRMDEALKDWINHHSSAA
jgi:uncharacterized protein (DUF4415 family)